MSLERCWLPNVCLEVHWKTCQQLMKRAQLRGEICSNEVDLESKTNNRMADAEDQVKNTHLAMRAPEATLQAKFYDYQRQKPKCCFQER